MRPRTGTARHPAAFHSEFGVIDPTDLLAMARAVQVYGVESFVELIITSDPDRGWPSGRLAAYVARPYLRGIVLVEPREIRELR